MAKNKSDIRSEVLTVSERLVLLGLLGGEASIIHVKLMQDFKQRIGFDEEELQKLKFINNPDGTIQWTDPGNKGRGFEVGKVMRELIKERLEKLDKEKKIHAGHISLWEKFVGNIKVVD